MVFKILFIIKAPEHVIFWMFFTIVWVGFRILILYNIMAIYFFSTAYDRAKFLRNVSFVTFFLKLPYPVRTMSIEPKNVFHSSPSVRVRIVETMTVDITKCYPVIDWTTDYSKNNNNNHNSCPLGPARRGFARGQPCDYRTWRKEGNEGSPAVRCPRV